MKHLRIPIFWTLLLVEVLCQTAWAAPHSGFLHTASYQMNQEGEIVAQSVYDTVNQEGKFDKTFTRIWFAGDNTRTETRKGERLTEVRVESSSPWTAYPEAGRIRETPVWFQSKTPFPERTRQEFAHSKFFKNTPIETTLKGIRCWKYSWNEVERPMTGDVGGMSAFDFTFWVYADKDFPLVLQYQSSLGSRRDLIEFKLDGAMPKGLFDRPSDLKPILPFHLPSDSYFLEYEEELVIKGRQPSKSVVTETYRGQGKNITHNFSKVTMQGKEGEERMTTFSGVPRTYPAMFGDNSMLTHIAWSQVKLVGEESLPLGQAEIFELIESGSRVRYWIIDHPVWGSIIAQQMTTSAPRWQSVVRTRRLKKLEVSEAAPRTQSKETAPTGHDTTPSSAPKSTP